MRREINAIRPAIYTTVQKNSDLFLQEVKWWVQGPGIGVNPDKDNPAIGGIPIPKRSGFLSESIKRAKIYNWLYAIYADLIIAPYAKMVHDGTRKMKARRFMTNTRQKLWYTINKSMNDDVLKPLQRIGRS